MWRILLIAEREFRAYATTASFWLALAIGPLLMGVAALSMGAMQHHGPAPHLVSIQADTQQAAAAVQGALEDAAGIQGRRLEIGAGGTQLTVSNGTVRIVGGPPLNRFEAELVRRDLYALSMTEELRARGVHMPALPRALAPPPAPAREPQPEPVTRFAPVFLLWLTLVGALGMLLQSVVRERANRALEQLLAGARPPEIVFGKLLGVGAISVLVLAAWLGSAAAMALTPIAASSGLLAGLGSPAAALYAGGIYLMAFLMYGSALVCVGAAASDLPSAQNLSRPVFGLLLVIFFVSLASAVGIDAGTSWLVWVPPFTPFMLLLSPGVLAPWQEAIAWTLMAATTVVVTATASRVLMISPKPLFARAA